MNWGSPRSNPPYPGGSCTHLYLTYSPFCALMKSVCWRVDGADGQKTYHIRRGLRKEKKSDPNPLNHHVENLSLYHPFDACIEPHHRHHTFVSRPTSLSATKPNVVHRKRPKHRMTVPRARLRTAPSQARAQGRNLGESPGLTYPVSYREPDWTDPIDRRREAHISAGPGPSPPPICLASRFGLSLSLSLSLSYSRLCESFLARRTTSSYSQPNLPKHSEAVSTVGVGVTPGDTESVLDNPAFPVWIPVDFD